MKDIIKANNLGVLSDSILNEFIDNVGELPKDYMSFLLQINGGYLIKDNINLNNNFFYVSQLYGLYSDANNKWNNINWYLKDDDFKAGFPNKTIPIGDNHGGDFYLLNMNNSKDYGKIYYWNHELSNNNIIRNLFNIADNFTEFIGLLEKDEKDVTIKITETDDEFIIE